MRYSKTRKGFPALWESGGGSSNTGSSQIIADSQGNMKTAIYVPRRGSLCNAEHALIIVKEGDIVIETSHHRGDFNIEIYRIKTIQEDDLLEIEKITDFRMGEWEDESIAEKYKKAVEAAMSKALDYHCRSVYYANIKQ